MLAEVRDGSFASILAYPGHVRYSPHRDGIADIAGCPKSAKSCHTRDRYSRQSRRRLEHRLQIHGCGCHGLRAKRSSCGPAQRELTIPLGFALQPMSNIQLSSNAEQRGLLKRARGKIYSHCRSVDQVTCEGTRPKGQLYPTIGNAARS